jgi:hypothetical protein
MKLFLNSIKKIKSRNHEVHKGLHKGLKDLNYRVLTLCSLCHN